MPSIYVNTHFRSTTPSFPTFNLIRCIEHLAGERHGGSSVGVVPYKRYKPKAWSRFLMHTTKLPENEKLA